MSKSTILAELRAAERALNLENRRDEAERLAASHRPPHDLRQRLLDALRRGELDTEDGARSLAALDTHDAQWVWDRMAARHRATLVPPAEEPLPEPAPATPYRVPANARAKLVAGLQDGRLDPFEYARYLSWTDTSRDLQVWWERLPPWIRDRLFNMELEPDAVQAVERPPRLAYGVRAVSGPEVRLQEVALREPQGHASPNEGPTSAPMPR